MRIVLLIPVEGFHFRIYNFFEATHFLERHRFALRLPIDLNLINQLKEGIAYLLVLDVVAERFEAGGERGVVETLDGGVHVAGVAEVGQSAAFEEFAAVLLGGREGDESYLLAFLFFLLGLGAHFFSFEQIIDAHLFCIFFLFSRHFLLLIIC